MPFKESCFIIIRKNIRKKVVGLRVVLPKRTLLKLLSWKSYEIFRATFFTEHLSVTVSVETKMDFFP